MLSTPSSSTQTAKDRAQIKRLLEDTRKRGLTLAKVTRRADLDYSHVSRVVSGQRPLTSGVRERLFQALAEYPDGGAR
jgi:hypothetical protein